MTTTNRGMQTVPSNSLQPSVPVNADLEILDAAVYGSTSIEFTSDANKTLTQPECDTSLMVFADSPPTLTIGRDVIFPAHFPLMHVKNSTAQTLTLKKSGQTGVALASGGDFMIASGLTDVVQASVGGNGAGDVVGPASAVDDEVALFDGVTGKLIKSGGALAAIATTGDVGDLTGFPGGTSDYLRADGTFATPAGGGGGSGWTLVASSTVAGAAATTISFTGLDLATDQRYFVEMTLENVGGGQNASVFFNADTTATNYYSQYWAQSDSTSAGARANTPGLLSMDGSSQFSGSFELWHDTTGRIQMGRSEFNRGAANGLIIHKLSITKTAAANLTGFQITAAASSLAIGSNVKVWKRS